jgi:hypothetical protein
LPPCPECLSSEDVVRHSWRDNRLARRVQGLDSHYFIMSRRYKCQGCAVKHFKMKESAKAAAEQLGMHCVDSGKSNGDDSGDADEDCADVAEDWAPPKYTFMAWNQQSLAFMDYKRGMESPAFLTHRGGVDNLLLDKMRPDFNKGVRPATFASTVLECCSKKHVKAAIRYEFEHSAKIWQNVQAAKLRNTADSLNSVTRENMLVVSLVVSTCQLCTRTLTPASPSTWMQR